MNICKYLSSFPFEKYRWKKLSIFSQSNQNCIKITKKFNLKWKNRQKKSAKYYVENPQNIILLNERCRQRCPSLLFVLDLPPGFPDSTNGSSTLDSTTTIGLPDIAVAAVYIAVSSLSKHHRSLGQYFNDEKWKIKFVSIQLFSLQIFSCYGFIFFSSVWGGAGGALQYPCFESFESICCTRIIPPSNLIDLYIG